MGVVRVDSPLAMAARRSKSIAEIGELSAIEHTYAASMLEHYQPSRHLVTCLDCNVRWRYIPSVTS